MINKPPLTNSHHMPAKRTLCSRCQYVDKNCLCADITPQKCHCKIIILQHQSESKHSKNSAKLVNLCIENCQLIVGEQASDFVAIQEQISHTIKQQQNSVYLVYPAKDAGYIENISNEQSKPTILIFIDASWRKAYKMWQQNPWLHQLPTLTFNNAPKTRYQIRKHKRETSLSTLEAVAYSLEQLENADTNALNRAFDAMIQMHNRYRP